MNQRGDIQDYPVFKKPIDYSSLYIVYDLLTVQKSHNKLTLQPILDSWDQVNAIGNIATLETFSRKVQGKLGGGPLVQKMIVEMDKMVASLTGSGGAVPRKPYPYGEDPDEPSNIPYKYVHYSAHDVSILSLMAALRLTEDYSELRKIPNYGAHIIVELHQSDTVTTQKPTEKDFYVRIRYNSGFNETSFREYSLLSLGGTGCQMGSDTSFNCSFSSFKDVCYADAIPHDWCMECRNNKADICVRALYEAKRSENTILMIMLPILGGFSFILLCFVAVICLRSSKLSRYVRGGSSANSTPLAGSEGINYGGGSYYNSLK